MMEGEHMEQEIYLLEFFGKECPHCSAMLPLSERLQNEEGMKVQQYEVWHNDENGKLMKKYDQNRCGGVPFFYNTHTEKWLCGGVTYEKLREWAL
jgi:ribosomal protein S27AE